MDIVHTDVVLVRIAVIETRPVRRKAETVGEPDAVRDRAYAAVEIDEVQIAGLGRIPGEYAERERAYVDAPLRVGRQVIEAHCVGHDGALEQRNGAFAGEALIGYVPAAHHQTIPLMERHPAYPASLRHHG